MDTRRLSDYRKYDNTISINETRVILKIDKTFRENSKLL